MGFLKKLKKVIKKIDPIGSKIHEKTGGKLHAAASKAMGTGVLGKLSNLDPVTKAVRRSSLGNALRGMGELNPMPGMQAPPVAPAAPPVAPTPAPAMAGQMAPPMAPPPMPMGNTGVMPPGMGAPAPMGPMGAPAARGAALRGFGGGGNRRMGGGY